MSDDDARDGRVATRLPEIRAEVRADGTGELSVDGVVQHIRTTTLSDAGAAVTARIAALAQAAGQALPAQVRDPDGLWSLLIYPDGAVDEAPPGTGPQPAVPEAPSADAAHDAATSQAPAPSSPSVGTPAAAAPAAPTAPAPASGEVPQAGAPQAATTSTPTPAQDEPEAVSGPLHVPPGSRVPVSGPADDLPTLDDLLAARHGAAGGPAERGFRKGVRYATFGLVKPGPGRKEQRQRALAAAVRRPFDGPRTVAVINPKGGAHKTTATMLLAATFGLQRGGYTLAWDNNETRGTLGWRSAHTEHSRTAVDLHQALPGLGRGGTVRIGDLDGFVRTQTTEQFDVLASDEDASSAASVDADAFRSLHQVLSRFYRVLVIDTGNNMRASNWQAAVRAADQIVIVSTIREDTAQSAAWALDALRAAGAGDAVRSAVTILSAPDPKVDKDLRKRLRSHFGALTRAVVEVPYDPALVSGGPIQYERLKPATRDAWLRATAVVADGL